MDELLGSAGWRRWSRRAVGWVFGRGARARLAAGGVAGAELGGAGGDVVRQAAEGRGAAAPVAGPAGRGGGEGAGRVRGGAGSELEGLVEQAVERLCRSRGPGLPSGDGDDPCMLSAEEFGE